MTSSPFSRMLPALPVILLIGCGIGQEPDGAAPDGGHIELLPGDWSSGSHTLVVSPDSTFEECLIPNPVSAPSLSTQWYCGQGRLSLEDTAFRFRPESCLTAGSPIDCDSVDRAMGDSMTSAELLLITLRNRERRFLVDVIIERECEDWRPVLFGETCVREGAANGMLELKLEAEGAPVWNRYLHLKRSVDPDSLDGGPR